jgi:hypothetical protein
MRLIYACKGCLIDSSCEIRVLASQIIGRD